MGIFDLFRKKAKAPKYDVTNLKVTDLDQGFIFDYNMKSWQVKEVYQYDWGNHNFSKEYKTDAGDEVMFLEIEEGAELSLSVMKSIKIQTLGNDIIDKTIKKNRPPKRLILDGTEYHLDTDSAGYFNNITKGAGEWEELISWTYYDDTDKVISITQWGERDFEAAAGKLIKPFEISNIIPASGQP